MVVQFNRSLLIDTLQKSQPHIGVEGDPSSPPGGVSEVDKIVGNAKRLAQEGSVSAMGVSGSNSSKGQSDESEDTAQRGMVTVAEEVEGESGSEFAPGCGEDLQRKKQDLAKG